MTTNELPVSTLVDNEKRLVRYRIATKASRFVLDRSKYTGPDLVFAEAADAGEVKGDSDARPVGKLTGFARRAVAEMFRQYVEIDEATARRALVAARNVLRGQGHDVNTIGAAPDTEGAAMGLATAYFLEAIRSTQK